MTLKSVMYCEISIVITKETLTVLVYSKDLNRERISTDGKCKSVSSASAAGAGAGVSGILSFFLVFITIPCVSVSIVSITIISMDIISIGILSISVSTMTMSIVAIPVSVCNTVINKGAIFIFTKLADKFRLQC